MYNKQFEYLLENDPEKVLSKKGIKRRKLFNPILRNIAPLTSKYKVVVTGRENLPKDGPVIFAPTHGFKDDFLFTLSAIRTHGYVLFGSLPQFFNTFDGISSWANGVVLVDRKDGKSRRSSLKKMEYAVDLGSNIIMFPEGVWNKSANKLVLHLFPGIYRLAKAKDMLIVPIGTHLDKENKIVYIVIGAPLDITRSYDADFDEEITLNEKEGLLKMRDELATLKYEAMLQSKSKIDREEINKFASNEEYWDHYVSQLVDEVDCYDSELENNAHFQPKDEISEDAVFDCIDGIEMTKENAFVLRKTRNSK